MKNKLFVTFLWTVFFMSPGTLLHAMESTRPIARGVRGRPAAEQPRPFVGQRGGRAQDMLIPGLAPRPEEWLRQRPAAPHGRNAARQARQERQALAAQQDPVRLAREHRALLATQDAVERQVADERLQDIARLRAIPLRERTADQRVERTRYRSDETEKFGQSLARMMMLSDKTTRKSFVRYKQARRVVGACLKTGLVDHHHQVEGIPAMVIAASLGEGGIVKKLLQMGGAAHYQSFNGPSAVEYAAEAGDWLSAARLRVNEMEMQESEQYLRRSNRNLLF